MLGVIRSHLWVKKSACRILYVLHVSIFISTLRERPGNIHPSSQIMEWRDQDWGAIEELELCFVTVGVFPSLSLYCCCCSVAKLCLTPCEPVNCSLRGSPVLHHLLEFAQPHVHRVGDAIQPSHPLLPPSPPALSLSQHQSLVQ